MGSHGGATAAGQDAVLADLGVTEATVGAPVRATMDVVYLGEAGGLPSSSTGRLPQADGIVLVNRVKPHTDFVGHVESGLMKMLVIGLGKQAGATAYHRLAVERGSDGVPRRGTRSSTGRILFGVALVENEEHRAAMVGCCRPPTGGDGAGAPRPGAAPPAAPAAGRHRPAARRRDGQGHQRRRPRPQRHRPLTGVGGKPAPPRVSRIVVRALTASSHGNACGLGSVDFVPRASSTWNDLPPRL